MIVFDLKCRKDHVFEAWFADTPSFEAQVADGDVQCPVCGDKKVQKAPMAPNVAVRSRRDTPRPGPNSGPPAHPRLPGPPPPHAGSGPEMPSPGQVAEAMKVLRKVRETVEKNFDHVGKQFPEEARKIHYGEVEKRNIYGDATSEEAKELADEGIEISQVPWVPRHDA